MLVLGQEAPGSVPMFLRPPQTTACAEAMQTGGWQICDPSAGALAVHDGSARASEGQHTRRWFASAFVHAWPRVRQLGQLGVGSS